MATSSNKAAFDHVGPGADGLRAEALWSVLASEPETGVVIVSIDGQILYSNVQAARIYFGPDAKPGDYVGKFFSDVSPREWAEERTRLLQDVARSCQPIRLRTIWRGYQVHSWIHPLPPEATRHRRCSIPSLPALLRNHCHARPSPVS